MKILLSIICALCTFIYVQNVSSSALLGAKECTWGPSYWCKNLTNAHNCGAVSHCIQTVWEHQNEKGDNDSVCKICKDMVKEARDQLESNETQEELKEVFEGSCKLIPIKVINQECIKLADDFIPDLVETLASQMNPEVVCSVAGLCNNERYDKLIAEEEAKHPKPASLADDIHVNDCSGCYTVMDKIEAKFSNLNENDFLNELLMVCGNMGSFSDACANIMVKYFDEIYGTLKRDLNSKSVCHISGMCSAKFHQHPELDSAVEIIPHGSTGLRPVDDDLPCDLCSQLVGHLRDLLIANTTESEFQQVLEGLCKQTNSFKAECLNIVDEYYPRIYYVLVNELKPQEVCVMAGLCPRPKGLDAEVPIWPLLQDDTIKNSKIVTKVLESQNNKELIGNDEANSYGNNERLLTDDEIQSAQLPIDRILPGSLLGAQSSQVCSLCEYALHYIQTELSDSRTEDEIKHVVESMCDKLPRSVNKECDGFVETYGDAVIAILAQEIDPSQVCPMLSLCPKQDTKDIEILIQSNANGQRGKSNCPLCLFAVKQLEDMVKDQKTEASIEHALDTLCETLPKDLSKECDDFVATYSHELIEMLIADLEPQEVCVYLKLCDPKDSDIVPPRTPIITFNDINNGGDILTNEIPDMTVGGQVIPTHKKRANVEGGGCVLCKMVVDEALKALNGSVNPDDIKHVFHEVCSVFSSPDECNKFVTTYIDNMIDLIAKHVDAADICSLLPVCTEEAIQIKSHVTDCVICEEVVFSIHMMLKNPHVDHDIEHLLKKACSVLPETRLQQCSNLMDIYGKMIIDLLERETNSRTVCKKLAICGANPFYAEKHVTVKRQAKEELLGAKKCTWGPSYWCDTLEKANECNALEHCRTKVWKSDSPPIKSK